MMIPGPDCALNVEVLGAGEPVTLFAHGITGSTDELMPLASPMHGTRVLMDFRGHGASESPHEVAGYDHPAMRRDVEHVADRFGASRAVGLSMGAGAILNLLSDNPQRCERVVLVTPASIDGPNKAAAGLFLEMADRLENKGLDDVLAWSLEGSAALIARRPQWGALIRERVSRMNTAGVPRTLRAYVHGRPPVTDASTLQRVTAPILILANEGDPIHDDAVARRLATLLPNARLKTWPEPLAMFDDTDALSNLIARFLDD
ncbi:MAG: alpha/beta fold hydrolase [Actinomycetota bacterium]|nr:alpha/beta hydrolase [Actinomycetota bacterium]